MGDTTTSWNCFRSDRSMTNMSDDVRPTHTIIPAAPGWQLCEFVIVGAESPDGFDVRPIVAWEIERSQSTWGKYSWREPGTPRISYGHIRSAPMVLRHRGGTTTKATRCLICSANIGAAVSTEAEVIAQLVRLKRATKPDAKPGAAATLQPSF
jgi:hypothetical protein